MRLGTIIFLAALAAVDVEQYEAATIDGANRWRQIWHITLPAIRSTIVILLILRMGSVLDNGFEQIYLMLNPLNRSVGEVFDTYVYAMGITQGAFSYSTAVGLFKSVVGVTLVLGTNWLAKSSANPGFTNELERESIHGQAIQNRGRCHVRRRQLYRAIVVRAGCRAPFRLRDCGLLCLGRGAYVESGILHTQNIYIERL